MATVQSILRNYLSARPDRTLGTISRRTGAPHSTLRRLLTGEAQPSYETAVSVLGAITDRASMLDCLRETFPETSQTLDRILSLQEGRSCLGCDELEILHGFVRLSPHCEVIFLAAARQGVCESRVSELFGQRGEAATQDLLSTGLLVRRGDSLHLVAEGFSLTSKRAASCAAAHLVSTYSYNPCDWGILGIMNESLNELGLQRINAVVKKCLEEIAIIKNDPNCYGNIPFYSVLVANTLDPLALKETGG